MSRTGSPSNFQSSSHHLFHAVEFSFDTGDVRLWSGYTDLQIDGDTYLGTHGLLGITSVSESGGISAEGIMITISGLDSTLLSQALNENYQFRPLTVHIGSISSDGTVQSYILFRGRMSSAAITDNANKMTIVISGESRLVDLERTRSSLYTDQQQRDIKSGDAFFDQIVNIQDREIVWQ